VLSGAVVACLVVASTLVPGSAAHAAWAPKVPPLSTPWTSLVSPTNALPEYPRHDQIRTSIAEFGVSASIYTQPVDVQNEVNGLLTYDRRVLKVDRARVRGAVRSVLAAAAALSGGLGPHRPVSLQVATPGLTDRHVRHRNDLARTDAGGDDLLKRDSTFWLRPGLADASCYSFESRNYPGHYLRHAGFRLRKDASDGSALFRADATFCARPGLAGTGTSFEGYNLRGHFIRHVNEEVYLARAGGPNAWDAAFRFDIDSSWHVAVGRWRSAVDVPVGQARSLQVTTPGFTDRFLRHKGFHMNKEPQPTDHQGGLLFARDATFCSEPGPGGVRLVSLNIPGARLRHIVAEAFIAREGGTHPWDNPASYLTDTTWHIAAPWAP
jgi:hypothetical protein